MIIAAFLPAPMTYLDIGSWPNKGTKWYEVGNKSNQKEVSNSHDVHATVAPVGICCQASHFCSLQFSQLGKIDDYLSPLAM